MTNKTVIDGLKEVLADSYTLAIKTQNYHWNVTGPHFKSLHLLFEEQYTELVPVIDLIAERIRALGQKAPGSYAEFGQLTSIEEANGKENATQMIEALAAAQTVIIKTLKDALRCADKAGDDVTVGMLTDRIEVHEKNRWMLSSSL